MNTVERIKSIQADTATLSKYLEIGVHTGLTFNNLNFDLKVAVDPLFSFDYEKLASKNNVFNVMTSDNFFLSKNGGVKYDLIFIDGYHEYKQTYRDFINCLEASHDKTIFIIDDVFPDDVYSASAPELAFTYRKLAHPETTKGSWMGDVYKTIALIHDLHPLISYKTIQPKFGNSQTFLFRSSRTNFQPKFKSIEEIERFDYFQFINDNGFLNLGTEEEVLSECINFLNN